MTDLEMTRLCAEALGYEFQGFGGPVSNRPTEGENVLVFDAGVTIAWNPLTNDAQAMALVKKFGAFIQGGPVRWEVELCDVTVVGQDLNRAIVECVAKMQMAATEKRKA